MNKKIKVNTYCRSFAYISFLNNKKKTYRAHFKLFPFLRKKVKGLEHYSYITVNNNQYKKLIKLERGGAAPTDLIENNINQRECNEEHYEQTNEKEYFDDFDDIDEEIIINAEHALRDWKNRSFKTPSTGTKHRSVNENADTCAEHFTRYCCHTRRETFSEPSRGNNKRQQQKTPNPAELRFFFSSFFLKKIIKQFCVK